MLFGSISVVKCAQLPWNPGKECAPHWLKSSFLSLHTLAYLFEDNKVMALQS